MSQPSSPSPTPDPRARRAGRATVTGADGSEVTVAWAAATETGLVRANNQDSYWAGSPVFVVADGMGGHSAGEVASRAVTNRFEELAADGFAEPEAIGEALLKAVEDIRHAAEVGPDAGIDAGTGTTVTGIALCERDGAPEWVVFNIGDSRVYLWRDDALLQVTTDHSVVQELVATGKITPAEAEVHPYGNVITRAVGFSEEPRADYYALPVLAGTRLLICSDGLSKELTAHGLAHFLSNNDTADAAVEALVQAALENGGRDNVTVIVIDVLDVTS